MSSESVLPGHHLAAICPSKGATPQVVQRPTPTPGPNDVLIKVASIALNPADHVQRDFGLYITNFSTILGSDVAGVVVSAGSSVAGTFKEGTHVAAFASLFYAGYDHLDYGAFQEYVLVPGELVTPLPGNISLNEGSLLPMAALTAWTGWYFIGLPRHTAYTPADRQGMLVWGGASSVGSAALQVAKSMGFTVYTTASAKHHEYLKSLGASRTFDYKENDVEMAIIKAAKEDGLTFQRAYLAAGSLKSCLDIVKALKGKGLGRVGSAMLLSDSSPKVDDVEATFIYPPTDKEAREEHFRFVFNTWLKDKLQKGEFVPSPNVKVVGKGLEALNKGLDELKAGVSGVKLVVQV
jgi:D-arabinose 1-dehydrogenase-like Zn-dependent alcohol dehydrogenase